MEKLLSQLPPVLRGLAVHGAIRSFPRNSVLLHEGEQGDTTWVLLQGRVRLYSQEPGGRELTYGFVDAGDFFAETWLDGGTRSVSAITVEPCICSVVPAEAVHRQLVTDPDFVLALVSRVIRRSRAATKAARDLALLDVYGRLVEVLEGQMLDKPGPTVKADQPIPFTLAPMTHQDLAQRVGASREMISRLLKDLERGGYVSLSTRRITLLRKLPSRW